MHIINSIKNYFRNLFSFKKRSYKKVIFSEHSSISVPDKDTIIIVKKNGVYSWAKFFCPCGCGKQVTISLSERIKPFWSVFIKKVNNKYSITFSPSVYLTSFYCKSHFFIRDNKIDWV